MLRTQASAVNRNVMMVTSVAYAEPVKLEPQTLDTLRTFLNSYSSVAA